MKNNFDLLQPVKIVFSDTKILTCWKLVSQKNDVSSNKIIDKINKNASVSTIGLI